jgi:hypothetical protein
VPDLEVAILARADGRRAFRRIEDSETADLLAGPATGSLPAPADLPAAEEIGTPAEPEDPAP